MQICNYGHSFDSHCYWIGASYELPVGWTWSDIPKAKKLHNIPAEYAPLASASGVVAWGILLPGNYKKSTNT